MERNGRFFYIGRSRYARIRHFFAKDRENKGEMKVEHYPIKLMIVNYLVKLLQGN